MELNKSQKTAIEDIDSSLWVEASAGTGKTEVLTRRYIEILDRRKVDSAHQILAFTFTEKASHEMKGRIFSFIQRKIREERAFIQKDSLYWKRVLSEWSSVAISTIHSFCSGVIREYAHELGQESDFEIVQKSELELELEIVLDRFLENGFRYGGFDGIGSILAVFSFEELRKALVHLVFERNTYEKEMKAYYENVGGSQGYEQNLHSIFLKRREKVLLKSRGFLEGLVKKLESLDLSEGISVPLTRKLQSRYHLLDLLVRRLGEGNLSFFEDMSELYKGLTFTKKDQENWSLEEYQSWVDLFKEFQIRLPAFWFGEIDRKNGYLQMKILFQLYEELCAWIVKHGTLLARWFKGQVLRYDDLQVFALEILRSEYGEEIASQYRHILVDEAQDLDSIQIEILEALLKKREAKVLEANRNPRKSTSPVPTLFMVGDLKQSIYGFRGARLSRFKDFMKGIPELKTLDLTWNYRSSSSLVRFVNDFFSQRMPTKIGEEKDRIKDGVNDKIENKIEEIEENEVTYPYPIRAFRKEEQEEQKEGEEKQSFRSLEFFLYPADLDKEDYKTREARWIADRILSFVASSSVGLPSDLKSGELERLTKEKIEEKIEEKRREKRTIRFGDIALLFRSLTDIGEYERTFLEAGIPYQVVDTKNFYKREEILDALQFLFLIEEPFNELALCGVLRSLFCGVSDSALYWVFHREDGSRIGGRSTLDILGSSLQHTQIAERERELLSSLYEILKEIQYHRRDRFHMSESLVFSLEKSQYWNILSIHKQRGKKKKQNLEILIQKIQKLEAKHWNPTQILSYFRFQSQKGEVDQPLLFEEGDMVSILSIHRAKGLEFPVVILPNLGRKTKADTSQFFWDTDLGFLLKEKKEEKKDCIFESVRHEKKRAELLESKRIFYVAVTRAKDCLLISGPLSQSENTVSQSEPWLNLWSDSLNELIQWFKRSGNPKLREYIESLQKTDQETSNGEKKEKRDKIHSKGNMIIETQSFQFKRNQKTSNEDWIELFFHVPRIHVPSKNTEENQHKEAKKGRELFQKTFEDWNEWNRKKKSFESFIRKERNETTVVSVNRVLRSLSASGILVYEKCPRKFYYKFVERIRESSETQGRYRSLEGDEKEIRRLPLNMLGNIVHKILEPWELQVDSIETILLSCLNIQDRLSLLEEKTRNQLKIQVKEILQKFTHSPLYQELQWSKKEYPKDFQSEFEFLYRTESKNEKESENIFFEGSIDKIFKNREGNWVILDYKTTHVPEEEKLKQKIHEYQSQMNLYALVASKLFSKVAKLQEGILHFLDLDHSARIPYSQGVIEELQESLLSYREDLQNKLNQESLEKVFFPKPLRRNCFFCGYWNCDARNSS